MTKADLLQELSELLAETLHYNSFALAPASPENGGLAVSIGYVRIEVWMYGSSVAPKTAWRLAVELAALYASESAPVMAFKSLLGEWRFWMPSYVAIPGMEKIVPPTKRHDSAHTVEGSLEQFSKVLEAYQRLRDSQAELTDTLDTVLGAKQ